MASNDLILRPKVDQSSLRKSSRQMENEYANSGVRAARTTAQFTQQALTRAYRLASRAGASAMHSAFQVGLQGIMQSVGSMLRQIDDTIDRVEGRAGRVGGDLVNRASALGVAPENLAALELVAGQKGVGGEKVDVFLQRFQQALSDRPQLAGFAQQAEGQGLETAFVSYLQQYGDMQGIANLGIALENQKSATMLAQQLQGETSFGGIIQRYGGEGATIEGLQSAINRAVDNNNLVDANAALMEYREYIQAGATTQGDIRNINATRLNDQQIDFQRETTLDEGLKIRLAGQELTKELNKLTGSVIAHLGKVIDVFKSDGIEAAFGVAIEPVTKLLGTIAGNLKTDIKAGMQEALGEARIFGQKVFQDNKAESAVIPASQVRQPAPSQNPMIAEIPR
ncbi:hypothetical protein NVP1166O_15 [Vibrio phage 1.166.O._10N.261.51.C7]|nr:hypothetical protein NVP1166O_15 [Vibrio phage 1.166.O._10N.261.51.C7]AUR94039.1 hypothetical protein NVP1190O_15 [Vibrio phage 1.190.O._10N.286.51.F12]